MTVYATMAINGVLAAILEGWLISENRDVLMTSRLAMTLKYDWPRSYLKA